LRHFRSQNEAEKEFIAIIDKLCYGRMKWQVWEDLITAMACSISITVDRSPKRFDRRKEAFARALDRMGGAELPGKAMDILVEALEDNPDQDFLGSMYMRLELGSHYHGQFFTPYNLSSLMARVSLGDMKQKLDSEGWISMCDPCIGGGAMMIAGANYAKEIGINYQQSILFAGQDIDNIAGMMAYIQLSLLGCPGYIVIANTLTNPLVGDPLMPTEKEEQDFWYTPFYFRGVWETRKQLRMLQKLDRMLGIKECTEKKNFTFFFEFERS